MSKKSKLNEGASSTVPSVTIDIGATEVTNVYNNSTIGADANTVICNQTSAFDVYLPVASVGKTINIKNVGAGAVTVKPSGFDVIEGEASQEVRTDENLSVQYYESGKWGIL